MPFNESGGGADLSAIDTLAELNTNLTDATLDDASATRPPSAHNHTLSEVTDAGTAATKNVGTAANQVVQLNGSAQIPALDGSLLTGMSPGVTDYDLLSNRPYVNVPITGVTAELGPSSYLRHSSPVITAKNCSVFGWFKPSSNSGWQFFYRSTTDGTENGIGIINSGGTLQVWVNGYILNSASLASHYDTWIHIGFTLDAADLLTIYLNGTAVASATSTGTISVSTNKVYIGVNSNLSQVRSWFAMAHLAEWASNVLTAGEITELAGGTAPDGIATTPTRYYGDLSVSGGYVPTIGTGTFATAGSVTDASTEPAVSAKDYIDGDATTELATANQGVKADSATQPGDLGTVASLDVPASGNAAAGEVVKGDDTRVTDALQTVTYAANIAPDVSLGRNFICTLTGNVTLDAPTGGVAGSQITLTLVQDAIGSRLLTISANIKTPTESIFATLSTGANISDVLMLIKDPTGGANWYITNMKTGYS